MGGLARAAELDEPQARVPPPQLRVEQVGVPLPGLDAGSGRIWLDSLGERVTEGEVVADRRAGEFSPLIATKLITGGS
jgi:hypothetical protein